MSEKALSQGAPKPSLKDAAALRLYSMRFCPWSASCRIALLAKNVPHDVVNINLRRQPDWFLQLNAAGTVPVLEQADGKVVVEAVPILDYIDTLPGESLYTSKEEERAFMEKSKTLFQLTNELVSGKNPSELSPTMTTAYHENMNVIETHLKTKGTKFLFRDDKPSAADFCVFPLLNVAQSLCDVLPSILKPVDMGTHPKLSAWMDAIGATDWGNTYVDYFDLVAFNKGLIMDKEYLYDEGLF